MTKKATKKAEDIEQQEINDSSAKSTDKAPKDKKETKNKKQADKASETKADKQTSAAKKKTSAKKKNKAADDIKEWEEKTELAIAEAKEWQDKYMRLSAEFDNYRKRTLKEKADLTKQANSDLLKDILPVIDDFERGKETIEKSTDIDGLKQGVDLIYTKFLEFIRQNGVKEIEAKELEFDLDFHEALTKIPAPTEELKGKVVDVIEKGYLLNDKVIRYSKVVVGE